MVNLVLTIITVFTKQAPNTYFFWTKIKHQFQGVIFVKLARRKFSKFTKFLVILRGPLKKKAGILFLLYFPLFSFPFCLHANSFLKCDRNYVKFLISDLDYLLQNVLDSFSR